MFEVTTELKKSNLHYHLSLHLMMIATSTGHMIAICNIPSWLLTSKANGEPRKQLQIAVM